METQKTLTCSTFRGFSTHKEDRELIHILTEIVDGKYQKVISRLRSKLAAGNDEEAARVKKQLPGATLSATYTGRRLPANMTGYNDIIMLDFDKLNEKDLARCRAVIQAEAGTLFCFLSPSGNGLKVGVYLQTPSAVELRNSLPADGSIALDELEKYHKRMFSLALSHYESITGACIDSSGSDIGRLFFVSHDPHAYIAVRGIEAVRIPTLQITLPAPAPARHTSPKWKKLEMPGNPEADCSQVSTAVEMEFQRCIQAQDRLTKYHQGQRSTYLFALGNRCYRKGLPLPAIQQLAERYFGAPDMDVTQPVADAYRYTDRTDRQEEEKNKPIAARITEFVSQRHEVRYNLVMKRFEYRSKDKAGDFVILQNRQLNSIYYDLNMAGINCSPAIAKTIIQSNYAYEYHPFEAYYYGLPLWDRKTDYIGMLADTVQTTNQAFWRDCLRRWLVGMVACALTDNIVNQLALVIRGEQGKGKSTWIRNLLPPELKLHYRNGMLTQKNKDHALAMTTCLIINLEEFEGMSDTELGELKRMITQESVMERKSYEADADLYIRRASIIASTNEPRFLQDISGTRRFPTVTALEIDYRTPVNHAGIYAQALYLWKNNFRYWFEDKEIESLNHLNQEYVLATPEEELLYTYFARPEPTDYAGVKWLPAAAILTHLSIYGKIQVTNRSMRMLTRILERGGFEKRKNGNGIFEYWVRGKIEL